MTEFIGQAVGSTDQPWYAVRTFNCQEQKVSRFLTEHNLTHFIPMTYTRIYKVPKEGEELQAETEVKPILVPAVHNLLFIQKSGTPQQLLRTLKESIVPISIFRRPGEQELCEIPARDMLDVRMLCDPQFKTSEFMTQGEAEAMVGKEVRVINGPFKGAIGRLVRKHKQYYFLKTIIGMGVMVRISRWYCEPIN